MTSKETPSIDWGQVFPIHFGIDPDEDYDRYLLAEEEITLPMADGTKIRGWFLKRGAGTPLVAIYAGNGMNVGAFHRFARQDTSKSYLLLNYRGYGRSEGSPTENDIVSDSLQAIEWAQSQLGAKAPLILIGYSIGSGVAMQVAAQHQPDALILICPFNNRPTGEFSVFRSDEVAPQLTCPTNIMAGTEDDIIAPARTKLLISAFKQITPQVQWFVAGHNDIMSGCDFRTHFKNTLARYQ